MAFSNEPQVFITDYSEISTLPGAPYSHNRSGDRVASLTVTNTLSISLMRPVIGGLLRQSGQVAYDPNYSGSPLHATIPRRNSRRAPAVLRTSSWSALATAA